MLYLTTRFSAFGTRGQEPFRTELLNGPRRRGTTTGVSGSEVLPASLSRRPASCRLCRRAKRFKLLFGVGRQDKVALSQTLNLVRPDLDLALPPGQIQIGMMALGLRDSPNLVRKCQQLREVLEGVAPLQMPSPVEFPALS
jgi:hypothetical protein